MRIRLHRLDKDGEPTGEPFDVDTVTDMTINTTTGDDPDDTPYVPITTARTVNLTIRIPAPKELAALLLGPTLMAKARRAQRHRARIVHVPKRHRKHGRIGVYR